MVWQTVPRIQRIWTYDKSIQFHEDHYSMSTAYYLPKMSGNIVPEKSVINRLSASRNIDLCSPTRNPHTQRQFTIVALWLTSQLTEGRNSVRQNAIVPGAWTLLLIVSAWITNEFSLIYHVMHYNFINYDFIVMFSTTAASGIWPCHGLASLRNTEYRN